MFTRIASLLDSQLNAMYAELHRLAYPLGEVSLTFMDGPLAGQEIEADIFTKHVEAAYVEPLRAIGIHELDSLYTQGYSEKIIRYRRDGNLLYLEAD